MSAEESAKKMTDFFQPLKRDAIEEKIKLNLNNGLTLHKFKESLYDELYQRERLLLKAKYDIFFVEIQIQNLKEQISAVEEKLQQKEI